MSKSLPSARLIAAAEGVAELPYPHPPTAGALSRGVARSAGILEPEAALTIAQTSQSQTPPAASSAPSLASDGTTK